MNYKLIFVFLVYYAVVGALFSFGSGYLGDSSTNAAIAQPDGYNPSNLTGNETGYTAGVSENEYSLWQIGKKIFSTALFMFFGIGLPSDTPAFMQIGLFIIQTCITIFAILVFVGAIRG